VKDLGVIVDRTTKFHCHVETICAKAKQRAALIFRCFASKDPDLLFKTFTTYVRPILEYCSEVWSPHHLTDIKKIESVQRQFTKGLRGLKGLSYSARLKRLNTDTLELRRLLNDLVMVYKIMNYHVALNAEELFYCNKASNMLTRGHSQRLFKPL